MYSPDMSWDSLTQFEWYGGFPLATIVLLVVVALVVFALAILAFKHQVNPTNLFTTSALITAVVALSLQDTLGNILGGLALQLDQSIQVGDWVTIDQITGQVVEIGWRQT